MKSRIVLLGLLGAHCLAAPVASAPRVLTLGATSDGVSVLVGEEVQFQDGSAGEPTSWSWDFTYDGEVPAVDSVAQNPLWTFDQAGLWAVRLEVCNAAGCSDAVKRIEVVEPCPFLPDLVLSAVTVADAQTHQACRTITAGAGFAVVQPGEVVFRAGRTVVLGSGFSVGNGARLRVEIDPALDRP